MSPIFPFLKILPVARPTRSTKHVPAKNRVKAQMTVALPVLKMRRVFALTDSTLKEKIVYQKNNSGVSWKELFFLLVKFIE